MLRVCANGQRCRTAFTLRGDDLERIHIVEVFQPGDAVIADNGAAAGGAFNLASHRDRIALRIMQDDAGNPLLLHREIHQITVMPTDRHPTLGLFQPGIRG